MSEPNEVTRVRPAERVLGDPTPGKVREQAIAVDGLWSGFVRTEPGETSGWHHHGEYDTSVYVIEGTVRIEFGPGGAHAVEAGPGDFLHIPKHVVHREGNSGTTVAQEVVTRSGTGPVTINVDGPAPPSAGVRAGRLGACRVRQTWRTRSRSYLFRPWRVGAGSTTSPLRDEETAGGPRRRWLPVAVPRALEVRR